jgi:protein phosphatase
LVRARYRHQPEIRLAAWNNLKQEYGPFDIIGDIHGCFDELADLLGQLGYS